ncbi:MAG: hypothetical protein KIS61_17530 [Candidatus Eremiobacteraeota bacterium]|nr:hypothetical protein [Candidatus Eremiobacteraeota bacterium]
MDLALIIVALEELAHLLPSLGDDRIGEIGIGKYRRIVPSRRAPALAVVSSERLTVTWLPSRRTTS